MDAADKTWLTRSDPDGFLLNPVCQTPGGEEEFPSCRCVSALIGRSFSLSLCFIYSSARVGQRQKVARTEGEQSPEYKLYTSAL